MRILIKAIGVIAVLAVVAVVVIAIDRRGEPQTAGDITPQARPAALTRSTPPPPPSSQAADASADRQILFGDVHAHTTFSMDAFAWSVPVLGGEGIHPPADACDYARFVAALDFWALTDHAESLTPRHWDMTVDAVRGCNMAAGDPANPDLVTFLGWEWTQMGNTAETHYGHRNVFLLHDDAERIPERPIAAGGVAFDAMRKDPYNLFEKYIGPYITDFERRQRQVDQTHKQADLRSWPVCADGVPVRDLPADCIELANTPEVLHAKLADWGYPVLAVPHGTTWGYYTPPGYDWDKQVDPAQADSRYERLIEIFSGHGNAEEYRDWRAANTGPDGELVCPEPTPDYLPGCYRAGEIIRARCDDPASAACAAGVDAAQQNYLEAGRAGHLTVPGTTPADWLDAGQCQDCYLPPLNHRPAASVQYILAKRNFEVEDAEQGFGLRFGFIGSSDNHNARPGNGFKEIDREVITDAFGPQNPFSKKFMNKPQRPRAAPESRPFTLDDSPFNFLQVNESERQGSFFYSGGLVAVHSDGRDRESVWDALQARRVYATSGPRILVWFDLLDGEDRHPMGSIVPMDGAPQFEVRALGAFEQQPGCPQAVIDALGEARLNALSGGECHHPGDVRHAIDRIEIVRIRPQVDPDEPIGSLIDDPWRVHDCDGDATGCTLTFSDPEFTDANRETLYYVRVLQAPTPTINADTLRCERDDQGQCIRVDPCYGDPRTPAEADCTAPAAERAWSSPIYVQPKA